MLIFDIHVQIVVADETVLVCASVHQRPMMMAFGGSKKVCMCQKYIFFSLHRAVSISIFSLPDSEMRYYLFSTSCRKRSIYVDI